MNATRPLPRTVHDLVRLYSIREVLDAIADVALEMAGDLRSYNDDESAEQLDYIANEVRIVAENVPEGY